MSQNLKSFQSGLNSFDRLDTLDTFDTLSASPDEDEPRARDYVAPPPQEEWQAVLPPVDRLMPLFDQAGGESPGSRCA